MTFARPIYALSMLGFITSHAAAALMVHSIPNTGAAPAGFVSNDITVDTDADILSAVLHIKLDSGVLYNPNLFGSALETIQQGAGDTYVTIGGNPDSYMVSGAGDLGHQPSVPGLEFGPTTLAVTYFDVSHDDIGVGLPMGTFSFSDDATGRGLMGLGVAGSPLVYIPFDITNGALPPVLPEPQTTFTPLDPPTYPQPPQLPPPGPGAPPAFFRHVPQNVVPGVVVNDLVTNTGTDWENASVLIELWEGAVYNSSPDFNTPPDPGFFTVFPALEYDTYVGVISDDTTTILGPAGNIPGGGFYSMAGQRVDVSWTNGATNDTGTFALGRFSLSDDAYGTVTINVDGYTYTSYIYYGYLGGIPEPASFMLLGFGMAGAIRRSRV